MPKAARARVASPSAGTALARAAWDCLPGRVRLGEVWFAMCNRNKDICQYSGDDPYGATTRNQSRIVCLILPVSSIGIVLMWQIVFRKCTKSRASWINDLSRTTSSKPSFQVWSITLSNCGNVIRADLSREPNAIQIFISSVSSSLVTSSWTSFGTLSHQGSAPFLLSTSTISSRK